MLTVTFGSIFDDDADYLVCPVNSVGVMGAGLAKQFKMRYPGIEDVLKLYCQSGLLQPGQIAYASNTIFAATKDHWKQPSKIEWVEGICEQLAYSPPCSIAVPALGCGLGGLKWGHVFAIMKKYFEDQPEVDFRVYQPA